MDGYPYLPTLFNESPEDGARSAKRRQQRRVNVDDAEPRRTNEVLSKNLIKIHNYNDVDIKTSHRCYCLFRIDIASFEDGRTIPS
jgi:hypothetical protein